MADKAQAEDWIGGLSDAWGQAMQAWEHLAKGSADFDPFAGKMAAPTQAFAELLAGFGKDMGSASSAHAIAQRWRELLVCGGLGEPFAGLQTSEAVIGFERWLAPLQQMFGPGLRGSLDLPAFGPGRERQERWQALLKAQQDAQGAQLAWQGLLAQVMERAFALFESKLSEHDEPGRQLTSVRAIYDLWIDAAEEAWAEMALSDKYAQVCGEMVNTQSRLRIASAVEVDAWCKAVGIPTRAEVTASHRKVHALEREVRALKAQLAEMVRSTPPVTMRSKPQARAVATASGKVARPPVARKSTPKTNVARKPAVRRRARA